MTGASINAPSDLPFLSALEKCQIKVHHLRMTNNARLIVHFSCPQCVTVYRASQEERPQQCSGHFHCDRCGAPVLEWTGFYDFASWKAVTSGLRQRRW